jgi:predicted nucleic acid-binding protein
MTRVLLDTNVVLDVLLDRHPWNVQAIAIWQAHLQNQIAAHMTATSVTDVFYVARRLAGRDQAWRAIRACLDQLYVIAVGATERRTAPRRCHVLDSSSCKSPPRRQTPKGFYNMTFAVPTAIYGRSSP